MNSQLEEAIGRFVQDVRMFSAYEAVHFELGIGTNDFTMSFTYRTPADLKREGVSMRNLNGQWIRAAEKEESPKTIAQQAQPESVTLRRCCDCGVTCDQRSTETCYYKFEA